MILVNKFVLSSYNFNDRIFLMLYQNFVSVIIVGVLNFTGLISTEPLTYRLMKVWFPVNVIFAGMLITSMFRCECVLHLYFYFWVYRISYSCDVWERPLCI